jgi:phage tail-like protein
MERKQIEALLPGVFRDGLGPGRPLDALLGVIEALHRPCKEALDREETYFCPMRAPEPFLLMLARWVGLHELLAPFTGQSDEPEHTRLAVQGLGRFRGLIASAATLHAWRGTARGLQHFLEIGTGIRGFQIDESPADEQGEPLPFHLRVCAPGEARAQQVLIERIIESEKPAYVTCELEFESD